MADKERQEDGIVVVNLLLTDDEDGSSRLILAALKPKVGEGDVDPDGAFGAAVMRAMRENPGCSLSTATWVKVVGKDLQVTASASMHTQVLTEEEQG